jgi:hypothetical protein
MSELERLAIEGKRDAVVKLLQEVVPTYRPASSIFRTSVEKPGNGTIRDYCVPTNSDPNVIPGGFTTITKNEREHATTASPPLKFLKPGAA